MTTEEKATYFEETVRKSINPKKQADYISINEKGTAAKLGDNEIERIINAASMRVHVMSGRLKMVSRLLFRQVCVFA